MVRLCITAGLVYSYILCEMIYTSLSPRINICRYLRAAYNYTLCVINIPQRIVSNAAISSMYNMHNAVECSLEKQNSHNLQSWHCLS